jgi:GT2 family glycosyltransferase
MFSLLAPTRGRPQALQDMADSAHATATGPIEVFAYVDDDDPHLDQYVATSGVSVVVGPRIVLSDCWNVLARKAQGDFLHMSADDIRFRTPGWDQIIRETFEQFPDRIACVYGRDGIHDEKLATHGFISRRWFETVGYFTWHEFPCDFADTWLHDVAQMVGRLIYQPEVLIEHLHPIANKAEWDQTHNERRARGKSSRVEALYRRLKPRRFEDAKKLEGACF